MPTNDFVAFATGGSANVESQATYLADTNRTNGNQTGVASSALNNKAIRQATYVSGLLAQFVANQTGTNAIDNTVSAQFLAQLTAAIVALPPIINTYVSGSGTYNLPYIFFVASANATVGATYTNNSVTYTVLATISAALQLSATGNGAPLTSGTLTKASGTGDATITFYAVRSPLYLKVNLVGAGAGGGGSITGAGTALGSGGGNTTFGGVLTAGGAANGATVSVGGLGGTNTLSGSGYTTLSSVPGNPGAGGQLSATLPSSTFSYVVGGIGGASILGGAGVSGGVSTGSAAVGNGSGGSGGGLSQAGACQSGGGGGAGGNIVAIFSSPTGSYAYSVGAGGAAGSGGGGFAGGAGFAGYVGIEAHFQ